ncbi:MAG: hypothetical protein LBN39_13300 [Planctomycetaceae bacterium]|jgi:hypothetical protein|nr:hypothetical protein [Planctomycetaceae bacterium]
MGKDRRECLRSIPSGFDSIAGLSQPVSETGFASPRKLGFSEWFPFWFRLATVCGTTKHRQNSEQDVRLSNGVFG